MEGIGKASSAVVMLHQNLVVVDWVRTATDASIQGREPVASVGPLDIRLAPKAKRLVAGGRIGF